MTGCGGQGTRVPRRLEQCGPDGVAPRVHEGVSPVFARGGSGPWGVSHAPHKGAAEGTEDFVHKGRVCRLGPRLSADGGLQLLAHRQRPDLVDCEHGAQVGCCGGLCRLLALGDGLQLLLAVQVEPPCGCSFPGVRPAAPRPTYDFSSCFFPKFKKSAKRGSSRGTTQFFGFCGPKIGGGGSSYPSFVQKHQKP